MNILISGCSFSQWPEYPGGPNSCWPRYLKETNSNLNITNISEAAAGNQYIADSIIHKILENPGAYDQVLVMWSGVSRLDFLTDITDPAWNALYDSYGFYRRMDNQKLGYIFSGGQMGTWYKNPVAHKMFNEQYKVSSNLSLAMINLMEMVKLQNFLENKNIPYKFMSYVNYWNNKEYVSPNGDFGITGFPEVRHLLQELKLENWIFTNDSRDGIYELAQNLNSFMDDQFHPGPEAHRSWAEFVNSKLLS
jgi:hypothetical protein